MKKVKITKDIVEEGEVLLSKGETVELIGWNNKGEFFIRTMPELLSEIDSTTEPKGFIVYEGEWVDGDTSTS